MSSCEKKNLFYQGKKVYGNVFGAKINIHGQAKGPTNNVDVRNDGVLWWCLVLALSIRRKWMHFHSGKET